MRVVWAPEARDDLKAVFDFIARDDPQAARAVVERILSLVETHLPTTPNIGRPGRIDGTRELIVAGTPFIVPYRLKDDAVEVLRVYHAARRWPSAL
ncbi:MAG TPA: type II toxin-antitoxin system RelE/ParE family toxin [Alphaproteobacteria bacterium]|nr:type II toxin-antitoxin system RelE/ParE family toxin [Alphaproteobacteria bacterium]